MALNAVRRLFSREAEKRMESRITRFNRRVNYLIAQTDEVYHIIALHLGLSDSEMMVLYVLTDTGGECPLPGQSAAHPPGTRAGNIRPYYWTESVSHLCVPAGF